MGLRGSVMDFRTQISSVLKKVMAVSQHMGATGGKYVEKILLLVVRWPA